MRTKRILQGLLFSGAAITAGQAVGQASVPGNSGGPTDYLGWDNTNNFPLIIRHNANQPIEWYTDNTRRMRLQQTATYPIGSFANQLKYGSLLLSPKVDGFYNNGAKGPFSLLHLAAGDYNAQQASYRPWMNIGVTFTGNRDHGYLGQKAGELDYTDMVAHWSDNPGETLKDRFRFIFTSGYDSHAVTGAQSEEGLEFLRMWAAKYDDPRIGMGDWYAANLADPVNVTEPSERLDIVNGRLRIRQLPTDPVASSLTKFLVVDNAGVVNWRNLPAASSTCDWTLNPTALNNVSTAFGAANPNCPDEGDAVGIGMNLLGVLAPAKLNIATNKFALAQSVEATMPTANLTGIKVRTVGGVTKEVGIGVYSEGSGAGLEKIGMEIHVDNAEANKTRGIIALTKGASNIAYAGFFQANDSADYTRGLSGLSTNSKFLSEGVEGRSYAHAPHNIGVIGIAAEASINPPIQGYRSGVWGFAESPSASDVCYGVFGKAQGPDDTISQNGHSKWAGYFDGYTYVGGTVFSPSDAQLKQNIEEMSPDVVMAKLAQLAPKEYDFNHGEFAFMGLPTEHQYGLLSQEVQEVLPALVTTIHQPAVIDTSGNVINPAVTFKAMNYQGFIPLLIAGFKGLQQQLTTVQQENAAMQAQLAQCCAANNPGMAPQGGAEHRMVPQEKDLQEQRLLIIPNPVEDLTMLEYYVPAAGKVSLSVSTSDGKPMGTLREEQAEAGAYSYQWNTTKLAAGTYFCTYMLDGAVVVKRAVKVK